MAVLPDAVRRLCDTARLGSRWSSLPRGELMVMLLLGTAAVEFTNHILGVHNPAIATVFAFVWLRPVASRLSDLRRGHYQPWNISATPAFETTAILIGGVAPWVILQLLLSTNPSWVVRQSVNLPEWVRMCGAVLGILVAVNQDRRARTNPDVSPRAPQLPKVTLKSQLLMLSMLMMSGSAFIALLGTWWVLSATAALARERLTPAVPVLAGPADYLDRDSILATAAIPTSEALQGSELKRQSFSRIGTIQAV
jgi:hypothetical protein